MSTNSTFTATKEEWKRLANVDYFGMYVRAYIPFNAWMNLNYVLKEDRAKINAIKILSRQLEYCEENMEIIESALDEI